MINVQPTVIVLLMAVSCVNVQWMEQLVRELTAQIQDNVTVKRMF